MAAKIFQIDEFHADFKSHAATIATDGLGPTCIAEIARASTFGVFQPQMNRMDADEMKRMMQIGLKSSCLRGSPQNGILRVVEEAWKNDLSDRFEPMTAKELRQSLRRGSFVYPFLLIQIFAVVAMIVEFQLGHDSESTEYTGMMNVAMLFMSGPFWMVVAAICMVIMPMAGVMLMGQELEEGNHELLLLTKLNRWKVVLGKFTTLWGLCALTFISLLPYVVVRYLIGGVEWWHEAACGLTVLGGSSIIAAGAIGASAFKRTAARLGVLALFFLSMGFGCSVPVFFAALVSKGCGIIYHLTALAAVLCYTALGLGLARSRLRLSVLAYEMNPSAMIIGMLVFAPFVVGLLTAITAGWGGWAALLGVAFVATRVDRTAKAPSWMPPPPPNVPVVDA